MSKLTMSDDLQSNLEVTTVTCGVRPQENELAGQIDIANNSSLVVLGSIGGNCFIHGVTELELGINRQFDCTISENVSSITLKQGSVMKIEKFSIDAFSNATINPEDCTLKFSYDGTAVDINAENNVKVLDTEKICDIVCELRELITENFREKKEPNIEYNKYSFLRSYVDDNVLHDFVVELMSQDDAVGVNALNSLDLFISQHFLKIGGVAKESTGDFAILGADALLSIGCFVDFDIDTKLKEIDLSAPAEEPQFAEIAPLGLDGNDALAYSIL